MANQSDRPPWEWFDCEDDDHEFDETFAAQLVGRSLLVGITEQDHNGRLIRQRQVFGIVAAADRSRGICVRNDIDGSESWFPPVTTGITPAEPGAYRNRATGEVVTDPDYTTSWIVTAPGQNN